MSQIINILNKASKPARYAGGEYGAVDISKKKNADVRFCMCFPDLYEIGMSNLGTRILYYLLNENSRFVCERLYTPAVDFGHVLSRSNLPLFSLESKTSVNEFDFLGFSLTYELCYTSVLYTLELSKIPLQAEQRNKDKFPLIIGGGPCAVNPLPMARFFDLFVIGDGEEVLPQILELYLQVKKDRKKFLEQVCKLDGVFVPSLHLNKNGEAQTTIKKASVKSLEKTYFPVGVDMPNTEIVHQRANIELFRGCARGCRFCQAGYIYRPVRARKYETLAIQANELIQNTGYRELGLSSLSTGDYKDLLPLLKSLMPLKDSGVNFSLPSLRVDSFVEEYVDDTARKTTITFAAEAGTQRLRNVIAKDITEEEILQSAYSAFKKGYNSVKLYFMLGLPNETEQDIEAIFTLAQKVKDTYKQAQRDKSIVSQTNAVGRKSHKALKLNVNVSNFVPKPFTPFQWEAQASGEYLVNAIAKLKQLFRGTGITLSYHDITTSQLEAVLSRGDYALGEVILSAYKKGCFFDGHYEHFKFDKWQHAFDECKLNMQTYLQARDIEKPLPWEFVDIIVSRDILLRERCKAYDSSKIY